MNTSRLTVLLSLAVVFSKNKDVLQEDDGNIYLHIHLDGPNIQETNSQSSKERFVWKDNILISKLKFSVTRMFCDLWMH